MSKILKLITIPCEQISCDGKWLFTKKLYAHLLKKIGHTSQLIPVLLQKTQKGYDLVWGYEILLSLSKIQREIVGICVEMDELEKGLINLSLLPPFFDGPEKFIICGRYFNQFVSKEKINDFFNKIFEIYLSKKEIEFLVKWMQINTTFDDILISGNITIEIAPYILKFSEEEQKNFIPFFKYIRWGKNKAKIFLDLIFQISRGKNLNIQDILEPISSILKKDLSPNDKIRFILSHLREMRYPNLKKIEQEFEKRSSNLLKNNKRLKIIPSNSFETDNITLEARLDHSYFLRDLLLDLSNKTEQWEEFYRWYTSILSGNLSK